MSLLPACAPVFSDFQSARTLGTGGVEITPSFSSVAFFEPEEKPLHTQNNFGIRAGVGAHPTVDVHLAYMRIEPEGADEGINVIGFGPKFSVVQDRLAFFVPVGIAFGGPIERAGDTIQLHPTLLWTLRAHEHLEINPAFKALLPIGDTDQDVLLAFNLGSGISTDLRSWALRPEVGVLVNPGDPGAFAAFSLGISIYP